MYFPYDFAPNETIVNTNVLFIKFKVGFQDTFAHLPECQLYNGS